MEWKTIQIDWVLMKKYWKRGLEEDVRGLKQFSHEKLFKKLFLGVSRLGESRKLLDELATGVLQLASHELGHKKFRD